MKSTSIWTICSDIFNWFKIKRRLSPSLQYYKRNFVSLLSFSPDVLMTQYGVMQLGQHCLRQWLVVWRHPAITCTKVDMWGLVTFHCGPFYWKWSRFLTLTPGGENRHLLVKIAFAPIWACKDNQRHNASNPRSRDITSSSLYLTPKWNVRLVYIYIYIT